MDAKFEKFRRDFTRMTRPERKAMINRLHMWLMTQPIGTDQLACQVQNHFGSQSGDAITDIWWNTLAAFKTSALLEKMLDTQF
jgi:hypothetical protein